MKAEVCVSEKWIRETGRGTKSALEEAVQMPALFLLSLFPSLHPSLCLSLLLSLHPLCVSHCIWSHEIPHSRAPRTHITSGADPPTS